VICTGIQRTGCIAYAARHLHQDREDDCARACILLPDEQQELSGCNIDRRQEQTPVQRWRIPRLALRVMVSGIRYTAEAQLTGASLRQGCQLRWEVRRQADKCSQCCRGAQLRQLLDRTLRQPVRTVATLGQQPQQCCQVRAGLDSRQGVEDHARDLRRLRCELLQIFDDAQRLFVHRGDQFVERLLRGHLRVLQACEQSIIDRLAQETLEYRECCQPRLIAAIMSARSRTQRRDHQVARQIARNLAKAATKLGVRRVQQGHELLQRSRAMRGDGLRLLLGHGRVGHAGKLSECFFQRAAFEEAGQHLGISAHGEIIT